MPSYSVLLNMPKKKLYARIAITLPPEVLAAADRLARDLDRSRSWVVAEAIRKYSAGVATDRPAPVSSPVIARERGEGYLPGQSRAIGPLRLAQLRADLNLTPLERVLAAEETASLGRLVHPPTGQQILTFDRPEDYLRWKQRAMVSL